MPTKIEWYDETINPVVGCRKCSPGCDNCYAEKFAARLAKNPNPKISTIYRQVVTEQGQWNGRTAFNPDAFGKLRCGGKSVFLCSMGDLFHESVSDENIDMAVDCMCLLQEFRFLVLTKRPDRMADAFPAYCPPNVWLGVTVCNQQEADEKIPLLLGTTAVGRFVSVEPMLGPIDLSEYLSGCGDCENFGALNQDPCILCHIEKHGNLTKFRHGLDWVIVGGETGPGARPMHPDWARSVRDQCRDAEVPFFLRAGANM